LKWEIINSEFQPKDEKHLFDYTYQTYGKTVGASFNQTIGIELLLKEIIT
jgi:hypothetical protein